MIETPIDLLPPPVVLEVKDSDWMEQEINRLLVSAQYTRVLNSPPKCDWKGVDGTFAQISHLFPELSLNLIKRVVKETFECESRGKQYDAKRKERVFAGTHLIARNSVHERMVCDFLEHGLGIHHTTWLVNAELRKDSMTEVGASCV